MIENKENDTLYERNITILDIQIYIRNIARYNTEAIKHIIKVLFTLEVRGNTLSQGILSHHFASHATILVCRIYLPSVIIIRLS